MRPISDANVSFHENRLTGYPDAVEYP